MKITVPDDAGVRRIETADLLPDWRKNRDLTRGVGDAWLHEQRSPLLLVPSAIIDIEQNVLVNPKHPDASRFEIAGIVAFTWDDRLLQPPVVKSAS